MTLGAKEQDRCSFCWNRPKHSRSSILDVNTKKEQTNDIEQHFIFNCSQQTVNNIGITGGIFGNALKENTSLTKLDLTGEHTKQKTWLQPPLFYSSRYNRKSH